MSLFQSKKIRTQGREENRKKERTLQVMQDPVSNPVKVNRWSWESKRRRREGEQASSRSEEGEA